MKKIHILSFLFCTSLGFSQEAFHNFGDIQMHENSAIGFHMDVINNGNFDNNKGLAGFYNVGSITVSGTSRPVFEDVEVAVANDLILENNVSVTKMQDFIEGKVITPRDRKTISLDYIDDALYFDADDTRHVDGYSTIKGLLDFRFPIGDDFRLRPLGIDRQDGAEVISAAYYFEDPNFPNYFDESFDTTSFDDLLYGVSIFEFWDLNNASTAMKVTLTWDDNSNIPTLVDNLEDLRVVGWDKVSKQWVNLGNTEFSGDLNNGEIVSDLIIPDTYEVLTFGTSDALLDGDLEIYTAMSPNDDGKNDFFRIDGLGRFPENKISIYNRWGVLVYSKNNYHIDQENSGFRGISEGRTTINKDNKLPVGTYYYVLELKNSKNRSGYLYINM